MPGNNPYPTREELAELTEDSLAFELLAPWYPADARHLLKGQIKQNPGWAHSVVEAARRLAAEGKLGPVAQPEPETWEPTMRLRCSRGWVRDSDTPYVSHHAVVSLHQLWRSSAGAEEWHDVEMVG